ncbi:SH3 domain-containing protein [Myxococcus stipitatus]|nr:SH3 domain-containing protein [Myxococcus stipitatus]
MAMRTRATWVAATMLLALPGAASAAKVGDALYVKAKNTRVMESALPTANVVAILQPGETVIWDGADAKEKRWHKVHTKAGKKGVVFQSNLATTPPNMELIVDDKSRERTQVSPAGFVASGAAVKALSPGAIQNGNSKSPDHARAVAEIQELEKLAGAIKPNAVAAHAQKAGLFAVVGASPEDAAKSSNKATSTTGRKKVSP